DETVLVQHNPRPKLQGRTMSNWSFGDRLLLLIIFVVAGLLWWQVSYLLALFWMLSLAILYRSSRGYGRVYYDLQKDMAGKWRSSFHKGVWWRAEDTEGSRLARWLRRRHHPLKAQFVRISAEIDG